MTAKTPALALPLVETGWQQIPVAWTLRGLVCPEPPLYRDPVSARLFPLADALRVYKARQNAIYAALFFAAVSVKVVRHLRARVKEKEEVAMFI